MLGFYSLSVVFTYLNVASAVIGMYFAIKGGTAYAMVFLILAGIFDMFDGTLARRKERTDHEKCYGIQIDALADIVSFGVLPAVIGYALGLRGWYHLPIHVLLILAALTRLGYFNVTEIELQKETPVPRKYYEGLPVTSVAIFLPFLYVICYLLRLPMAMVYGVVMVLTAFAFVSRLKIPKPKFKAMLVLAFLSIPIIVLLVLIGEGKL